MQITDTENTLHKISGNTLQSKKKCKLTYAHSANEPSASAQLHQCIRNQEHEKNSLKSECQYAKKEMKTLNV